MDRSTDEQISISGLVIPTKWGKDGRVMSIAISTADEREVPVHKSGLGHILFGLVRKWVEARGVLVTSGSKESLRVDQYIVKDLMNNKTLKVP